MDFPNPSLAFFSNVCLNFNQQFETIRGILAMAKSKRLLSVTLLTVVGCTGFVLASQWGHAAEPPAYPVRATLESMQLLRDEHNLVAEMVKGQLAAERDRYKEQRTAISAPAVGRTSLPPAGGNALRSRRV